MQTLRNFHFSYRSLIVFTLHLYFVLLNNSARITWTVLCIAGSRLHVLFFSIAHIAGTNVKATLSSTAAAQAARSPSSPISITCHKWEQYYEIIEMFLDYYGVFGLWPKAFKYSSNFKKTHFTLSRNVFCTNVLIDDTILKSPAGGQSKHPNVLWYLVFFLSQLSFKTLGYWSDLGNRTPRPQNVLQPLKKQSIGPLCITLFLVCSCSDTFFE